MAESMFLTIFIIEDKPIVHGHIYLTRSTTSQLPIKSINSSSSLLAVALVARQTTYLLPWERLTACLARRLINTVRQQLLLVYHLRFEKRRLQMGDVYVFFHTKVFDAGYATLLFGSCVLFCFCFFMWIILWAGM